MPVALAILIVIVASPAFAQDVGTVQHQQTGAAVQLDGGSGGSVTATTEGGCRPTPERPCPKICDVLIFDGVGDTAGGACTMRAEDCVPLGGSPPFCGVPEMAGARAAVDAGESVTWNQYSPESTRTDATVYSTSVGNSEMNNLLSAFSAESDNFMMGPPMTAPELQEVQSLLGELRAESENFMTSAPPPVSYSTWRDFVAPIASLSDVSPESYSTWPRFIQQPVADTWLDPTTFGDIFASAPAGGFAPSSIEPYAGGSFRFDGMTFIPDAGPFDFGPNPSFIPSHFSSDYVPNVDRLDPQLVTTSPFSWYSYAPSGGWTYNWFEPFDARQTWWSIPDDVGPSGTYFEPPQQTWGEWATNAVSSAWNFGQNFDCRMRRLLGHPNPWDSC